MKRKVYEHFSGELFRLSSDRIDIVDDARRKIRELEFDHLPHGSGFDSGCKLVQGLSTPEKLVFSVPFHNMDEMGGYDGWSDLKVIVKPSLLFGIRLTVTGRDYHGTLKDYVCEVMDCALKEEVDL